MTSISYRLLLVIIFVVLGSILVPYSVVMGARPSNSAMTAAAYNDVILHENLFITTNRWGLELFDLDEKGEIRSLSRIHTAGRAEFVDIENDIAAVSNLDGTVEIFHKTGKIMNPVSHIDPGLHPVAVKVIGDYLYIGGLERALVIYDISSPHYPLYVSELDFTGYPHEFEIRNDTMFVAAYHGGVVLLDISTPSQPELLQQYLMPDFVYGLALDGPLIYTCAHRAGLYVLDMRWDSQPPVIGHNGDFGSARKAIITQDGLLVLDGFGALKLIDVSIPSRPEQIWTSPLGFNCFNFAVLDDFVFVANWKNGVRLLELNDKIGASIIDERVNYSICRSLSIEDGYIFAASGTGGLLVFDENLNVVETPEFEIEGNCLEVKTAGDLAFLSNDDYGLAIVDINDIIGVKKISTYESSGWVKSSASSGEYLYLANWQGIVTVNIQDITNPFEGGFYDTFYGSSKIEHRNDTLFVAGSGGLELYDISDPFNARFLSRFDTEYPSLGLKLQGDKVILSSGRAGVFILALQDNLNVITRVEARQKAVAAELRDNRLFVAEIDSGVSVWNLSQIDQPVYVMNLRSAGKTYDLAFMGNRLYVADYYGVTMFELPWEDTPHDDGRHQLDDPPGEITLYPNPVKGEGKVQFEISSPGRVNVDLYDILGRKVCTIYDGYSLHGENTIAWMSGDIASGLYFVRIKSDDFITTRQVTIVR